MLLLEPRGFSALGNSTLPVIARSVSDEAISRLSLLCLVMTVPSPDSGQEGKGSE